MCGLWIEEDDDYRTKIQTNKFSMLLQVSWKGGKQMVLHPVIFVAYLEDVLALDTGFSVRSALCHPHVISLEGFIKDETLSMRTSLQRDTGLSIMVPMWRSI